MPILHIRISAVLDWRPTRIGTSVMKQTAIGCVAGCHFSGTPYESKKSELHQLLVREKLV